MAGATVAVCDLGAVVGAPIDPVLPSHLRPGGGVSVPVALLVPPLLSSPTPSPAPANATTMALVATMRYWRARRRR